MFDTTTTIKGQAYRLIKLDPLKAGRMATRVAQQLAGAVSDVDTIKGLIQSHLDKKADGEQDTTEAQGNLAKLMEAPQLLSALAGGVAKINAEELYDCALDCVRGNLFADRKLHDDTALNVWFAENPSHLLLVLAWALKVNCAGFFGLGGQG